MTEVPTLLDAAHAALMANPDDDALRLRFYERLADGEMFLLLEREATGETLEPRIFPLDTGPVVLVFDREDRLAAFSAGVAPYAALPGRVIAGLLQGQGIGLGVNLGVAPSEILLPAEAMDWLAVALDGGPEEAEARPEEFLPPDAPAELVSALDAKLARAGGLATAALLAAVRWQDGRRGHLLALVDARPGAEPALARAAREALVFSGAETGPLDVIFLSAGDAVLAPLTRVALRFDLPPPPQPKVAAAPAAPGRDPAAPPRLR